MPDGRALKTLEVGLAAPSATGRIWWGNGYCCCKRKLPAASTAGGDGNRGICLQEVRNQWFAITLPQQQPVPVCFALIKEKDFKSGTQATAHFASALEHVTDPSVRGFSHSRQYGWCQSQSASLA